jgi:hypothetical protein
MGRQAEGNKPMAADRPFSKIRMDTRGQKNLRFTVDGVEQGAHSTWFRGEHCNFNPRTENMVSQDAVLKHVLAGWLPEKPLIEPDTRIVAFGSCFAANITAYLASRKFNVLTSKDGEHASTYLVRFGEGMVNSFVIRQQFEWALENHVPQAELWHGYDAESYGYSEDVRVATHDVISRADLFIITLGLAEVWYDEPTNGVFWRAVPQDKYDPSRHRFRVSSVEENRENIKAIYRLIRKHRPQARVIFTLSPIPLVATFRPVSCITANSVSKSIMRAALDEAYREINEPQGFYYWPSYEIVMDVFADRWREDRRHVKKPILDFIMTLFETAWCRDSMPPKTVLEAWIDARCAAGSLPKQLPKLLDANDTTELDQLMDKLRKRSPADAGLIEARRRELATR